MSNSFWLEWRHSIGSWSCFRPASQSFGRARLDLVRLDVGEVPGDVGEDQRGRAHETAVVFLAAGEDAQQLRVEGSGRANIKYA